MEAMRDVWTDERMDDLNQRVDRGFEQIGREFQTLRMEMRTEFAAVRSEARAESSAFRTEMQAEQRASDHECDPVDSPGETTELSGRRERAGHPKQGADHERSCSNIV